MTRIIAALLVGVAGIATLLTGLGIDAWLHAQDETLAAREGVVTLSNPGQLLLGIGMAMACGGILSALYVAWGMTKAQGILGRQWVRVISLQASGVLSVGAILFSLAVSASGHQHGVAGDAHAAGEAHMHVDAVADAPSGDVAPDAIVLAPSAAPAHEHDGAAAAVAPHAHGEMASAADGGQPSPAVAGDGGEMPHSHTEAPLAQTGVDDGTPSGDSASDDVHMHPDGMMLDGGAMPAAAHAHPKPTREELVCRADLTSEAKTATARFEDVNVAIAEGYAVSDDPAHTHMPNRAYMRDGVTFELSKPESLIYVMDDNGERRFVGALYKTLKGQGPAPCGNATYWHTHGRCIAADGTAIPENKDKAARSAVCPAGYEYRAGVVEMMHLWFVARGER